MNKTIILQADTFKYPTKEERNEIQKHIPKIERLKVNYKPAVIGILQNQPFETAVQDEDIYWWVNCFNIKLEKLTETYTYVKTHNSRLEGIQNSETENHYTDKILLDYFIEIFYYYYFSIRDVLAQLINVSEDLKIEERKIFLNDTFVKSIPSQEIKSAFKEFVNSTKKSYDIRNTFNHRFTPTHTDNRAKKNIIKEGNTTSFHYPTEVKVTKFIDDIDNLMKHLKLLTSKLITKIK